MAAVAASDPPNSSLEATLRESIARLAEAEKMGLQENKNSSIIEAVDQDYIQGISKPPYANTALADPFDEKIARKWVDEVIMKFPRGPPADCHRRPLAKIAIKNVSITYGSDDATFRVRVYVPAAEDMQSVPSRPALIMYHGGGWIHGYPEVDEGKAIVINVDYRLAPEHKFPLPLNDCYQAVQWTLDHAQEYGIDTARIAIWGCSAGGNLAAAVALRDTEEHKESRIRHVNLVVPATCHPQLYPMALKADESSSNKFGAGLGTAAAAILIGRACRHDDEQAARLTWPIGKYAGDKSLNPHVSVLSADIPANHPPVHITVAGRDFLRDEGIAYSLRIRDAGIDSQLDVVPGVPHGLLFPPTTHVARQFFRNQARILDYALNSL
ncbi:alpha/beta hydrolase domain-containing protein [Metarhizium anisopliae]|nr:alpha/beta hydrolase domain-containing protein [Metarhizium anisopliae]